MDISDITSIIIGAFGILIFLVAILIASYFWSRSGQSAYASTISLQNAMNSVCRTGNNIDLTLNYPQKKPITMGGLFSLMSSFIIRLKGDPDYLLYYESFPPGEAIGWEVYQKLPFRVLVPIIDGENIEEWKNRLSTLKTFSIPLNLILGNRPKNMIGTFGEWNKENYEFDNYLTLSALEKSSIKYMACGENSLCLKTTSGVSKFPLDYCQNIKSIRWVLRGNMFGSSMSDFYIASPCKVKVRVSKGQCGCTNEYTYDLVKYNNGKFVKSGQHTICTDRLGQTKNNDNGGECLIVEMTEDPTGFCVQTADTKLRNIASNIMNILKSDFNAFVGVLSGNSFGSCTNEIKTFLRSMRDTISNQYRFKAVKLSAFVIRDSIYLMDTEFVEKLFLGTNQEKIVKMFPKWAWPYDR